MRNQPPLVENDDPHRLSEPSPSGASVRLGASTHAKAAPADDSASAPSGRGAGRWRGTGPGELRSVKPCGPGFQSGRNRPAGQALPDPGSEP